MIKLQIVDGSLQVSNNGTIILVAPKNSCAIDVLSLYDAIPLAVIYNKYLGTSTNIFTQPLANCVDSLDVPFTVNTFIDFAEANLGFDTASGGCGGCSTSPFQYNANLTGIQPIVGSNNASGTLSTIGGGSDNTSSGYHSTIGGGDCSTAFGDHSTIGGGLLNSSNGNCSTIGGGGCNTTCNSFAFVGGGCCNTASNCFTTIGGGFCNLVNSQISTISGGQQNYVSGILSTIGGGLCNCASGTVYATIGGGKSNTASGSHSTIAGGQSNTASGCFSAILGGTTNDTNCCTSAMIVGNNITANRSCTTFVNDLTVTSMASCSGCSIQVSTNGLLTANNLNGGIHAFIKPSAGCSITQALTPSVSTLTGTTNRLLVAPFIPAQTITSASLYINVSTLLVGSNAQILVYSNLNGKPDTRLYQSANLDCSTTGLKTASTVLTFTAGTTYWVGIQFSSTQSVTAFGSTAVIAIAWSGVGAQTAFFITPAFGSAPATFGTPTGVSSSIPFVGITL